MASVRVAAVLAIAALSCGRGPDGDRQMGLAVLTPMATAELAQSLDAASAQETHIWRDVLLINEDGTVNTYIEIPRGDRRKWEYDMRANRRVIDRVLPGNVGGYPVNYGFLPQTVSYDGDPFDALVLGPRLDGGEIVRGIVVGLMYMDDDGELDSKVVLSPAGQDGRPLHRLEDKDRQPIEEFFERYKLWDPGKRTDVPGWGSADEGWVLVNVTHRFFNECRQHAGEACRLEQ